MRQPYCYRNLQEFIAALEKAGELCRVKAPVSRDLEISQITDLASKGPGGGKALLFERVVASPFPVLTNAFGSERRICMALGVPDLDTLAARVRRFVGMEPPKSLKDGLRLLPLGLDLLRFLPRTVKRAPCQEVVAARGAGRPRAVARAQMLASGWWSLHYPAGGDHAQPRNAPAQRRHVSAAGF